MSDTPRDPATWWAEMLASLRRPAPDDAPPAPREQAGDFANLTERQWHALVVERRYHERHRCDDR